ncbi:MAG TPA: 1-deoxy-D-xylulose-5-phosphate synthase, partial [Planctomycetota bacterium]|nr:1-deoxy-D-xylulose-5-phosphate synthase [Planctomycetota bacterium]
MKERQLDRVNVVNDIHKLSEDDLPTLAQEIRELIIDTVYKTGGHLGSNLGVVELTLALEYLFDVTRDMIVWDGSYQTYTHKILTGRKAQFGTLRQFEGLCGFGWKPESPHDPFNFGHVGTGLAAAFGVAVSDEKLGRKRRVIGIVGDGSMTSGVSYEALNNIGASKKDILVILNDNGFSIAPTVGALSNYLTQLRTAPIFNEIKQEIHKVLTKLPLGTTVEHMMDSVRRGVKQAIFPNIFTAFGFEYYGPIDGHDLKLLLKVLRNVKERKGPILLHVITKKGMGHPDADRDPFGLHKPVDPTVAAKKTTFTQVATGESKVEPQGKPSASGPKSWTGAFSDALTDLARKDPRVVAITAAMPDGTGVMDFAKTFPDRAFDVGISEQFAVAFAAGLAQAGMRPVCAIYSSFLQRAYDIIFQEACLNKLPVVFVMDRAGLAGEDGPTHHGNFDIAYFRTLPHTVCMAPKDAKELREMLELALRLDQPVAIRIPREKIPDPRLQSPPVELGKGEILARGRDGTILSYGIMTKYALKARDLLRRDGLDIGVANAR